MSVTLLRTSVQIEPASSEARRRVEDIRRRHVCSVMTPEAELVGGFPHEESREGTAEIGRRSAFVVHRVAVRARNGSAPVILTSRGNPHAEQEKRGREEGDPGCHAYSPESRDLEELYARGPLVPDRDLTSSYESDVDGKEEAIAGPVHIQQGTDESPLIIKDFH